MFLTFANHQAAFISRYSICHFLQSSRSSHVAVTSPPTSNYSSKPIALLLVQEVRERSSTQTLGWEAKSKNCGLRLHLLH